MKILNKIIEYKNEKFITNKRIFLGGTTNETTWRDELIKKCKNMNYFNPVVKDWNDEAKLNEEKEKETCDIFLINITPKMKGVFSIAEVMESTLYTDKHTIFSYQEIDEDEEFDEQQINSLNEVGKLVEKYGGIWIKGDLDNLINYINDLIK